MTDLWNYTYTTTHEWLNCRHCRAAEETLIRRRRELQGGAAITSHTHINLEDGTLHNAIVTYNGPDAA